MKHDNLSDSKQVYRTLKLREGERERRGAEEEEGLCWRPADGPLQTIEADKYSHKEQQPHTTYTPHTHSSEQRQRGTPNPRRSLQFI